MRKSQFKTYHLIFLFAFGAPALCSAQTNKKETFNINLLIDSLTNVLTDHYVFSEKAKSITTYYFLTKVNHIAKSDIDLCRLK